MVQIANQKIMVFYLIVVVLVSVLGPVSEFVLGLRSSGFKN
jgi:hypothetical protein